VFRRTGSGAAGGGSVVWGCRAWRLWAGSAPPWAVLGSFNAGSSGSGSSVSGSAPNCFVEQPLVVGQGGRVITNHDFLGFYASTGEDGPVRRAGRDAGD
jgi:hypothetical protein